MPDDAHLKHILHEEYPYMATVPNWWNGAPEKRCGLPGRGGCFPGMYHECPPKREEATRDA